MRKLEEAGESKNRLSLEGIQYSQIYICLSIVHAS